VKTFPRKKRGDFFIHKRNNIFAAPFINRIFKKTAGMNFFSVDIADKKTQAGTVIIYNTAVSSVNALAPVGFRIFPERNPYAVYICVGGGGVSRVYLHITIIPHCGWHPAIPDGPAGKAVSRVFPAGSAEKKYNLIFPPTAPELQKSGRFLRTKKSENCIYVE
jgi:hypothetical protein